MDAGRNGYQEGRNIVIEFKWADGHYERLPALFSELIQLNVDVIVTYGTPGTLAAKQATTKQDDPPPVGTLGDVSGTHPTRPAGALR
jgi:hypothetical protein